jgi:hypothetical protein
MTTYSQPTVCCDNNVPSDGFKYDVIGELAEAIRQAKRGVGDR